MDQRSIYEMLLETQCQNYQKVLELLAKIENYDALLSEELKNALPDFSAVEYVTIQKSRLVQKLDALSLEIIKEQAAIDELSEVFLDGSTNPHYEQLKQIRQLVSDAFSKMLETEDSYAPKMNQSLADYQERIELDEKINAIPKEKRHTFFINL